MACPVTPGSDVRLHPLESALGSAALPSPSSQPAGSPDVGRSLSEMPAAVLRPLFAEL